MVIKKKVITITVDVAAIGKLGGQARAANMTSEERARSASEAANKRWEDYYAEHPEKLLEKQARLAKKAAAKKAKAKPRNK